MDPLEIVDYKRRWMPAGYEVVVHSDLRDPAKDWCKTKLEKHQYAIKTWTHIYACTYCFERKEVSDMFAEEFKDWVDKGID